MHRGQKELGVLEDRENVCFGKTSREGGWFKVKWERPQGQNQAEPRGPKGDIHILL